MKKILIGILLTSASYSYAQTINAEQIKKDNITIRGNALHQLRADTAYLATHHYVDSLIAAGGSGDKVDSIERRPGTDSVFYYINGTEHFAFIDSVSSSTISAAAWALLGNVGTTPGTNFIGTIDSVDWVVKTNNSERVRVTGNGNVGIGTANPTGRLDVKAIDTLATSFPFTVKNVNDTVLFRVHAGGQITAGTQTSPIRIKNLFMGSGGLLMGDSAEHNTTFGFGAGDSIVNAERNSLFGYRAGSKIRGYGSGGGGTFGFENSYFGYLAGSETNQGFENSGFGVFALELNTTGQTNSAFGISALGRNTTGSVNTAVGANALLNNTTGDNNTAIGSTAGGANTTGARNFFGGVRSAIAHQTGDDNVFIGSESAGVENGGSQSVYIGFAAGFATTGGNFNMFLGSRAAQYTNYSGGSVIVLNTLNRSTTAKELTHMPIIIQQATDSIDQDIRLNGEVQTYALTDLRKVINTSAGDAATINAFASRFRKDTSGSTFTLTNALITANSIIDFDLMGDLTSTGIAQISYTCTAGSATITFYDIDVATGLPELKDPAANQDVSFQIIN